jgi:hypothetical protein
MVGEDDRSSSIGGDKQEQWVRDVIVLSNINRSGM